MTRRMYNQNHEAEVADTGPRLVEDAALPYLLSVPGGAPPERGWPLLFFLHGYDEAAPLEIRRALTAHGPLRPGPLRATDRFVVVAPQLPAPGGDVWRRHEGTARRILEQVRAEHRVDPGRQYLTGFSFGGNGVFDLGLLQPDLWAALWPVDPTRVPQQAPQRPVWLSVGEVARYRKPGFIRALRLEDADAGTRGDRLYLDQGEDHVGSAALAYQDERIYTWLLSRAPLHGAGRAR